MKLPWRTALHRETGVSRRTSRIRLVKTNCTVNLMFEQLPIEIGRLSHLGRGYFEGVCWWQRIGIKPSKKTALPVFLMFCDAELHQLLTTTLLKTARYGEKHMTPDLVNIFFKLLLKNLL